MNGGEIAGTVFVAAVLALLTVSLCRMRPRAPYLAGATAFLLLEAGLRAVAPLLFPEEGSGPFVFTTNPAARTEEDLGWPNWLAMAALTALAAWLAWRPARRSALVGTGLALLVPAGWLNLVEPLARGSTTDYLLVGDWVLNAADAAIVAGAALVLAGLFHWEVLGGRRRSVDGGDRPATDGVG